MRRRLVSLTVFALLGILSQTQSVADEEELEATVSTDVDVRMMSNEELGQLQLQAINEEKFGPTSICGEDTRKRVANPRRRAEIATCLLFIKFSESSSVYQGTGFIVSERLVVTAGHCVYDHGLGGWAEWVQIAPGANQHGDYPFGQYSAARLYTVRGFADQNNDAYDYGAVKLADSTMFDRVKAKIDLAAEPDARLQVIKANTRGYPANRNPSQSQWFSQPAEPLKNIQALTFSYDVDTEGGNSGGPVFDSLQEAQAIGIHTQGICPNDAVRITEQRRKKILEEWAK